MRLPIETILFTVGELLGLKKDSSVEIFNRKMKAMFGLTGTTITEVWNRLNDSNLLPDRSKIEHLLWTLSFYKCYDTLDVYCCRYKVTKVTFWKWVKLMTYSIYQLKIVSKKNVINKGYIFLI